MLEVTLCPATPPNVNLGLGNSSINSKSKNQQNLPFSQIFKPYTCLETTYIAQTISFAMMILDATFYRLHQIHLSLRKSDLIQLYVINCPLAASCWKNLKSLDNQLASISLLTTCSRLFVINAEQVMRTHPDICLMKAISAASLQ